MNKQITIEIIIRSLLYKVCMIFVTIFVGLTLPFSLFSKKIAHKSAYLWGKWFVITLKYCCKIDYKVEGVENIPKGSCIIASQHQSAWETAFLLYYFYNPAFIFKKSLLWIPVIGQYLYSCEMIYVDRSKGKESLRRIIAQSNNIVQEGRKVIIFPEGTRVLPGESKPYKSGIYAIAKNTNQAILPIALNSGEYWQKNSFIKFPGVIRVKILKTMSIKEENKNDFLKKLQSRIEKAL